MKKALLVTLLFSISFSTLFAQVTKPKSTRKKAVKTRLIDDWEKGYKEEFSDCGFTNKYTAQQRMSMYPFSKAAKVLAVSFKYGGIITEEDTINNDLPKMGLHINKGILDTTTLIEMKVLNSKQIDELTTLIFNTDYKKKWEFHTIELGKCFEPRNALIFLDLNGRVLDYLQICFECKNYHCESEKFDIGVLCNQKYQLFSNYFKSVGVPYGTIGRDYRNEDIKYLEDLKKLKHY